MGERAQLFVTSVESAAAALSRIVAVVMWLAPVGAFGAMAFTPGKFGWHSLAGFIILRLVRCLRTELITVIGTSSSESVLAPLIERLEKLGCSRAMVGVVVPTVYSFNLDGTWIYLPRAALFPAQALDVPVPLSRQLRCSSSRC